MSKFVAVLLRSFSLFIVFFFFLPMSVFADAWDDFEVSTGSGTLEC